jgi:hypothetical protein
MKKKNTRLRDNKGRFISGLKEKIIREMAKNNKKRNAQKFLNDNYKDLELFIKDNSIDYTFNENNFESAISNKQIFINGEKVSKGEAIIKIQQTISYIKRNFTTAYIQIEAKLTNEKTSKKGKYKKDSYNKIEIKLPRKKKPKETKEEYLDFLENECDEITIYGS